jgi:hypothetical protein
MPQEVLKLFFLAPKSVFSTSQSWHTITGNKGRDCPRFFDVVHFLPDFYRGYTRPDVRADCVRERFRAIT